jgi:hypothetical protein
MQLDVIVLAEIRKTVFKKTFEDCYYNGPGIPFGLADYGRQRAVVIVDLCFDFEKSFSALNIVGYCVRKINGVALHELAHLCDCDEIEADALEAMEGILEPPVPL